MASVDVYAKAVRANAALFFLNGAMFGNWVARIPTLKEAFSLSESAIGMILLGLGLGGLVAMVITGWLLGRYTSKQVLIVGVTLYCLSMLVPAFAPNVAILALGAVLFGMTNGAVDVSINKQAVEIEDLSGRKILGTMHGLWSTGGLAGATMGGAMAQWDISFTLHFVLTTTLVFILSASGFRWLVPVLQKPDDAPAFAKPPRALLGLGCISFSILMTEGAIGDWSGLYLKEFLGSGPGMAASGFAIYSLCMATGRFAHTWLLRRFEPQRLLLISAILSLIGITIALTSSNALWAITGFGLVGLGMSSVFPLLIGTAARYPGIPAQVGIAATATSGYTGFLLGPALIGFLAEATTLHTALYLLIALIALVALLHRSVSRPSAPPSDQT